MKKVDLVGLPSGQIVIVTDEQFRVIKDNDLITKVVTYRGISVGEWCFNDDEYWNVYSTALGASVD